MNPLTRLTLELTAAEIESVLHALLEAPMPLKISGNLFNSIRAQRDAAVKKLTDPESSNVTPLRREGD